MKRCGACGVEKPRIEFHRHAGHADGLASYCKQCQSAYIRAYRLKMGDALKEKKRAYRWANRNHDLMRKRLYAASNRRQESDRASQWAREHPDRVNLRNSLRRVRVRANGGEMTPAEWRMLCATYEHRCIACGRKRKLEPDHVIPVKMGGRGDIGNIQPLCRACNARKGARHIDYRPAWQQNRAARQLSLFGGRT